jgi:uncharacterized membrane protein YhfC
MCGVATAANRGDGQSLLEQADAMDTVLVVLQDIGLWDIAGFGNRGILAMAGSAR